MTLRKQSFFKRCHLVSRRRLPNLTTEVCRSVSPSFSVQQLLLFLFFDEQTRLQQAETSEGREREWLRELSEDPLTASYLSIC